MLKEKENLYFFTNFKAKLESEILAKENELILEAEQLKELKRKISVKHVAKPIDIDLRLENLCKEEAYLSRKLKMILKTNFNLKKKLQERLEGKKLSSKAGPFNSADIKWDSSRKRSQNQSTIIRLNEQGEYEELLKRMERKGLDRQSLVTSPHSKLVDQVDFEVDNLKYGLAAQKISQESSNEVQLHKIEVLESFLANDCMCKRNLKKILRGTYEVNMCPKRCLLKLRYLIDQIITGFKFGSIQHHRKESKLHENQVTHLKSSHFHQIRRPINLSRLSGVRISELVDSQEMLEPFSKKSAPFKQTVDQTVRSSIKVGHQEKESEQNKNESSSGKNQLNINENVQQIAALLKQEPNLSAPKAEKKSTVEMGDAKMDSSYDNTLSQSKVEYMEDSFKKDPLVARIRNNKKVSIKLSEPNVYQMFSDPISMELQNNKDPLKSSNENTNEKNEKPKDPETGSRFHTYNHKEMIRSINKKKAKTTITQPVHELLRFKSYDLLLKMKSSQLTNNQNAQKIIQRLNDSLLATLSDDTKEINKSSTHKSKTNKTETVKSEKKNYETPRESTVEPVTNKSKFFSQNQFLSKFKTMTVNNRAPSGSDSFIENEYEQKPVEESLEIEPIKCPVIDDHLRDSGSINHSNSFKSVKGRGQFNFNFEEDDSKTVVTNFFDMKSENCY